MISYNLLSILSDSFSCSLFLLCDATWASNAWELIPIVLPGASRNLRRLSSLAFLISSIFACCLAMASSYKYKKLLWMMASTEVVLFLPYLQVTPWYHSQRNINFCKKHSVSAGDAGYWNRIKITTDQVTPILFSNLLSPGQDNVLCDEWWRTKAPMKDKDKDEDKKWKAEKWKVISSIQPAVVTYPAPCTVLHMRKVRSVKRTRGGCNYWATLFPSWRT